MWILLEKKILIVTLNGNFVFNALFILVALTISFLIVLDKF